MFWGLQAFLILYIFWFCFIFACIFGLACFLILHVFWGLHMFWEFEYVFWFMHVFWFSICFWFCMCLEDLHVFWICLCFGICLCFVSRGHLFAVHFSWWNDPGPNSFQKQEKYSLNLLYVFLSTNPHKLYGYAFGTTLFMVYTNKTWLTIKFTHSNLFTHFHFIFLKCHLWRLTMTIYFCSHNDTSLVGYSMSHQNWYSPWCWSVSIISC